VFEHNIGQATLFLVLALGIFLIGALCLAFDVSNMWFHRQAAQTAADAACTAGAMDLLVDAQSGATGHQGFTAGTGYSCTTSSTDSVCKYAAYNGYNSNGTSPGNLVNISFPSLVIGVTPPGSTIAPTPFIRVDILDHVQSFFLGLLSGSSTEDVRAFATCGVELSNAPIPLLILNPTVSGALSLSGTPGISIYGGPQRAIQVNSKSTSAASGGGTIDTSLGGPDNTGSDFAVYGGPSSACCSFSGGTTGHYDPGAAPILDPLATVSAPGIPSFTGATRTGPYLTGTTLNGCPAGSSCDEYGPGYYPSGISVSGTAIFDPGIYYVLGGMSTSPNSCVYPSTATGDGSGGTMFYFADSNSFSIGSNSGKPNKCPYQFPLTTGTGSLLYGAFCTAAAVTSEPKNLPSTTQGNILLAPCQAPTVTTLCAPNCSINYGDPLGTADPSGEQRGILFFQYRSAKNAASISFSGGGQFLFSGTIYIHQCVATNGADTGVGCTAFGDSIAFAGNPGSGTYIVGEIIADKISMVGTSNIIMDLSSSSAYRTLKASLLQ
jgi:hypothetical protein